jgi:hypothetical protein
MQRSKGHPIRQPCGARLQQRDQLGKFNQHLIAVVFAVDPSVEYAHWRSTVQCMSLIGPIERQRFPSLGIAGGAIFANHIPRSLRVDVNVAADWNSVSAIERPDWNVHFAVCQRIGSVAATVATERVLWAISDEFPPGEPHKAIAVNGDLARRTSTRSLPAERAVTHADLRMPANYPEADTLAQAAAVDHVESPFSDNSPSMTVPMVAEHADDESAKLIGLLRHHGRQGPTG